MAGSRLKLLPQFTIISGMVFKLIFTIALLVAVAVFSGFNLDNRCDIWLFGRVLKNAPIFMSILISFAAGILVTLPAVFFRSERKMTPEQARALADRLEQNEKRQLEKQIARQKRLEEAKARAQAAFPKKSLFSNKEKPAKAQKGADNSPDAQTSAPQESK